MTSSSTSLPSNIMMLLHGSMTLPRTPLAFAKSDGVNRSNAQIVWWSACSLTVYTKADSPYPAVPVSLEGPPCPVPKSALFAAGTEIPNLEPGRDFCAQDKNPQFGLLLSGVGVAFQVYMSLTRHSQRVNPNMQPTNKLHTNLGRIQLKVDPNTHISHRVWQVRDKWLVKTKKNEIAEE